MYIVCYNSVIICRTHERKIWQVAGYVSRVRVLRREQTKMANREENRSNLPIMANLIIVA